MSTLPPEIISYILRQLPVKSLLRFRCTSKPWCSLIDDPQFTKLHLNHSIHTNSNQRLLLKSPQLCSVNLDLLDRAVEIDHPLKSREDNTQTGVLGSCNGLLCLCNSDEEIVLFNLSTGKHFKLPESGLISHDKAVAHNMIVHSTAGFGYDSVHEDYKLLRIVQFRHTFDSEVMLYSLKSNSWKRVSCFPYGLPIDKTTGVFASGALHWIVAPKGLMDRLFLIAFDLATEEYREVPEPFYGSDWDYFLELGVLEGRICVVCNHVRKCSDFWVMNDYGVKESWAKLLSIAQPQLTSSFDCFKPVVYLHNRNGVVLIQDDKKLLSYDLKTNKVKRVGVRGVPVSFDALPYVESLVNPMPMATGSGGDGPVGKQGKGRNRNVAKKRNDFLSKGFKLVL